MSASYCENPFSYRRRISREVMVGNVGVGGANPIRVQSMLTCDTMDTAASIEETLELAQAGCEIVRITAPTVKTPRTWRTSRAACASAAAMCRLSPTFISNPTPPWKRRSGWRRCGSIRAITPTRKSSRSANTPMSNTPRSWSASRAFTPLVKLCKELGRAMRIGTNHGSLSDRIMNRYGDTPLGMVESALEFARIARELDYHNFVFSMKSSNPKVMIEAYRLLVARLDEAGRRIGIIRFTSA